MKKNIKSIKATKLVTVLPKDQLNTIKGGSGVGDIWYEA